MQDRDEERDQVEFWQYNISGICMSSLQFQDKQSNRSE